MKILRVVVAVTFGIFLCPLAWGALEVSMGISGNVAVPPEEGKVFQGRLQDAIILEREGIGLYQGKQVQSGGATRTLVAQSKSRKCVTHAGECDWDNSKSDNDKCSCEGIDGIVEDNGDISKTARTEEDADKEEKIKESSTTPTNDKDTVN